ncbi:MAG: flagellar basal body-associated FliL family protein [Acidobacteria bacterium]|nr:flagellar basal body-associated FliL family protein [Acidobacteriota bacterium]
MATTPTVTQTNPAESGKLPLASLIIAVALGVIVSVAAVGGAGYYLIHSGKLRLQTAPPAQSAAAPASTKTHAVMLEPMVVNLADSAAGSYLRISMTLNVGDPADAPAKEEKNISKEADSALRDTALTVLGKQTSEGLLAADGKERLKTELKAAFVEHNPEIKVMDLYITEFLVQR